MPYSKYSRAFSAVDALASRLFTLVTFLYIGFITLASLTPGHFKIASLDQFFELFFKHLPSLEEVYSHHDLRDLATNVLLYIPLGIFLSLSVPSHKPRFITPWIVVGFAVSVLMETAQLFIGRYVDPVDLVTNTTGYVLGFWISVYALKFIGFKPSVLIGLRQEETTDLKANTIASLRFIYVVIYLIVALLPFDVTVSLSQIYDKLLPDKQGHVRIILDPLYHFKNWSEGGARALWELAGLIPVALFTGFLDGLNHRLNILSAIYVSVVLALITETAQIFIISRTSDVFLILLAAASGALGWFTVKVWFKLQDIHQPSSLEPYAYRKKLVILSIIGYMLFICLLAWAPFEFEYHLRTIIEKARYESNLIPFKGHFSVRNIGSAVDIVREVGLYVPLGILMTFFLSKYYPLLIRRKILFLVGFLSMALASFLELSQSACIGRYIDFTDILLATAGGILGAFLLRLFVKSSSKISF